jgi:hypothetical protein
MTTPEQSAERPFVGPRSYNTGEKLFGREGETLKLLDRLIAERIILLYSPSGAGKTSLVQAALVPALRDEDFTVPAVARVTFDVARGVAEPAANRYVFALLLRLEEALPREQQISTATLARMTLVDYLDQRWPTAVERGGWVLIVDQFEEVLTVDPTDWAQKKEFFSQLGAALRREERWALFSMREEHIAALEPYRDLIPTRLHSDFRLDLLNNEQAQRAMRKTTELASVVFEEGAARRLANDLRRVRVQRSQTQFEEELGPTIEPTVLQVVCLRLWNRLPSGKKTIDVNDIIALGSADTALADYYAETTKKLGAHERKVREWIDEALITQRGLRNQVLEEDAFQSGRIDAPMLKLLEDSHLIRAEQRRGVTWLELAHDRLLMPIRTNNVAWLAATLTPFQRQAVLWDRVGRPSHLELRGKALTDAERWAKEHPSELIEADKELLRTSAISRRRRRSRTLVLTSVPIALVLAAASSVAYLRWFQAQTWAYLTDLSGGQTYEAGSTFLFGLAALGRKTPDQGPQSQIALPSLVVSRLHVFISKALRANGETFFRAEDMRSLNGTTINARFLRYGSMRELRTGDLVALAGVAAFRFQEKKPSYVPFWEPVPPHGREMPQGAWAILIDGATRSAVPLYNTHFFLNANDDGSVKPSESLAESSVVEVEQDPDRGFALRNRSKQYDLFAMFKHEDRLYLSLQVPPGKLLLDRLGEMGRRLFASASNAVVSGTEYMHKMSFCLGPPKSEKLDGFEGLAEIESDDEPACAVGPFQILIPEREQ